MIDGTYLIILGAFVISQAKEEEKLNLGAITNPIQYH